MHWSHSRPRYNNTEFSYKNENAGKSVYRNIPREMPAYRGEPPARHRENTEVQDNTVALAQTFD
jgi:hypothetical protein